MKKISLLVLITFDLMFFYTVFGIEKPETNKPSLPKKIIICEELLRSVGVSLTNSENQQEQVRIILPMDKDILTQTISNVLSAAWGQSAKQSKIPELAQCILEANKKGIKFLEKSTPMDEIRLMDMDYSRLLEQKTTLELMNAGDSKFVLTINKGVPFKLFHQQLANRLPSGVQLAPSQVYDIQVPMNPLMQKLALKPIDKISDTSIVLNRLLMIERELKASFIRHLFHAILFSDETKLRDRITKEIALSLQNSSPKLDLSVLDKELPKQIAELLTKLKVGDNEVKWGNPWREYLGQENIEIILDNKKTFNIFKILEYAIDNMLDDLDKKALEKVRRFNDLYYAEWDTLKIRNIFKIFTVKVFKNMFSHQKNLMWPHLEQPYFPRKSIPIHLQHQKIVHVWIHYFVYHLSINASGEVSLTYPTDYTNEGSKLYSTPKSQPNNLIIRVIQYPWLSPLKDIPSTQQVNLVAKKIADALYILLSSEKNEASEDIK